MKISFFSIIVIVNVIKLRILRRKVILDYYCGFKGITRIKYKYLHCFIKFLRGKQESKRRRVYKDAIYDFKDERKP